MWKHPLNRAGFNVSTMYKRLFTIYSFKKT